VADDIGNIQERGVTIVGALNGIGIEMNEDPTEEEVRVEKGEDDLPGRDQGQPRDALRN
jgi:hypothetical protein